jgi:hypothetical protein
VTFLIVHDRNFQLDFDVLVPRTGGSKLVPILDAELCHRAKLIWEDAGVTLLDGFMDSGALKSDWVNGSAVVLLEVGANGILAESRRASFGVRTLFVGLVIVGGFHSWSWSVG